MKTSALLAFLSEQLPAIS